MYRKVLVGWLVLVLGCIITKSGKNLIYIPSNIIQELISPKQGI